MFRQISKAFGILLTALLCAETAHAAATKTITLNNSANQAIIEDDGIPSNRLVRIRSLNNSFATITFELPTSELIINLCGGKDTLEFDGTNITGFTAKLTINGAAGNDTAVVRSLTSSKGVCWKDTQGTTQSLSIRNSQITGEIQITDGDGAGGFTVDSSRVGPVSFTSTNGNMAMFFYYSLINGKLNLQNKGNGTDTVRFDGCTVSDDVYLDMGNGPIGTQALFSAFHGNFSLLAGSGSFTSTFGDCVFSKSIFQDFFEGTTDTKFYFVQVNGSVELDYGLGFDQTLLTNLSSGIVNIRNGDGGSKVSTWSQDSHPIRFGIGLLNITSGEGADTFTTKHTNASTRPGGINSLEINSGIGNSVTELTDPRVFFDHVKIAAGTGYDVLTFGPTEIGDIVADLHDGGSSTTFDHTTVGYEDLAGQRIYGPFVLYGGADNDQVLLDGNSTYGGPVYLDLAGGTDLVEFSWFSRNPFLGPLVLDGGADSDTIFDPPSSATFPGYLEIINFEFGL